MSALQLITRERGDDQVRPSPSEAPGMSTNAHPETCRCALHKKIEARRHDAYRQLAFAILGSGAPREDLALARALAEHAGLSKSANRIAPIRFPRAA